MAIMEKIIRCIYNIVRIIIIKAKCGDRVHIPLIQPMRIRTQLMIKKNIKKLKIGKNFKLETDGKIRVVDGASLCVGDNCFINCGSYITVMGKTVIGDNCIIGPNVMIFDHDHNYKSKRCGKSGDFKTGEIIIGDNVWIGANCVILKGSNIGNNSVIAAGSIVNSYVPDDVLFVQKKESKMVKIR